MANFNWIGGTTAVAHVMTATVENTWSSSTPDTIKTTIYDEGGTAWSVTTNATGSDIETNVIDPHVIDLNASTIAVFAKVTWVKASSTTFTATADVAGVPLSGNDSGAPSNLVIDASTTASNGTVVWANTTANAGPNDANTDANWTDESEATTTSPLDDGVVRIIPHPTKKDVAGNPLSYDILYGLDQSDIDLAELRIGKAFKGLIGNVVGDGTTPFYFHIDAKFPGGSDGIVVIDSSSPSICLRGDHDAINVAGLPRGVDALHLHGGGGTTVVLRLLGPRVLGKVTIADTNDFQQIESIGAHMEVEIGTQTGAGNQIDSFTVDGGTWIINRGLDNGSNTAVVIVTGGIIRHMTGDVDLLDNRGGTFFFNSTGLLTRLHHYNGITSFEENTTHGPTVSATKVWGGQILDKSGLKNVTWSTNPILYGGSVTSDTATTQSET